MIVRTLFRMLWVVVAFFLAALAAVVVLFALGAVWAGDEIRAAAPNHPLVRHGGEAALGFVVFAGRGQSAPNAFPTILGKPKAAVTAPTTSNSSAEVPRMSSSVR